jgi:hypothetical protein
MDRLPAEEKEIEGFRSQLEAESALKRWANLSRLRGIPTPDFVGRLVLSLAGPGDSHGRLPRRLLRKAVIADAECPRPITDEPSPKPVYNEANAPGPEPLPTQKRPLSDLVQVAPARSLSELKTLKLGSTQREGTF